MPAIAFEAVAYRHPGGRLLFDGLDLSIERGEVVALVGRSGAGKTTLLRLVNRLVLPERGRVLVDGQDTRAADPIRLRRGIGYVIQEGGLFPHMTVGDNVATVPRLEGWAAPRIEARVTELLRLVGLEPGEFAGRWPDQLSGGQRQRVGVARALAADPPILLMDEPFGALDPITRREIQLEFRALQASLGKTVLLVTHDIAEALTVADRIAVFDRGALVACAGPAALLQIEDRRVRDLVDAARPLVREP